VVFYGTTGRVYAVEADSGELRWRSDIGAVHQEMATKLEAALKAGKLPRWNRGVFKFAPIHAADVFVLGDGRGGLVAFDQKTGERRWVKGVDEQHKRGWGIRTNPVRWHSGGRDVLVVIAGHTTHAFDAATGKELWQARGPGNWSSGTAALAGDLLVGNKGVGDDRAGINCWRLTPTGCEEVWSKDASYCNFQACSVLVYRDHVWAFKQAPKVKSRSLACLDLATGEDRGPPIEIHSKGNSSGIAAGGLILQEHHGISEKTTWDHGSGYAWCLYTAEPGKVERAGGFVCGIANSVTPIIHDGRLYVRLTSGLACYDLRRAAGGSP
jgi:outer membrane protein assembly factor BamB